MCFWWVEAFLIACTQSRTAELKFSSSLNQLGVTLSRERKRISDNLNPFCDLESEVKNFFLTLPKLSDIQCCMYVIKVDVKFVCVRRGWWLSSQQWRLPQVSRVLQNRRQHCKTTLFHGIYSAFSRSDRLYGIGRYFIFYAICEIVCNVLIHWSDQSTSRINS